MRRKRLQLLVDSAVFLALIAVSAQITLPLPSGVPVTLQTLVAAACGYVLGGRRALMTLAAYFVMGAVGLPVFAGFQGGLAALVGRTGGFLVGFLFLAGACGFAKRCTSPVCRVLLGLVGLVLCHATGVLWFSYLTGMPIPAAFAAVSLPFLLKDAVCVAAAALLVQKLPDATVRRFQ